MSLRISANIMRKYPYDFPSPPVAINKEKRKQKLQFLLIFWKAPDVTELRLLITLNFSVTSKIVHKPRKKKHGEKFIKLNMDLRINSWAGKEL